MIISETIYVTNRKATHHYKILDKFICGMILTGQEVKSIMLSNVSISEGFVSIDNNNGVWLENSHVDAYHNAHAMDKIIHRRKRKLLLNKSEISKLKKEIQLRGNTIVPLSIKRINNKLKLEIGLAKGKNSSDKRNDLKDKQSKRDMDRELKNS